jgi:hypothetical protein
MRQVILQEFVSLDGLAAGPNASVDFVPASTRGDRSFEKHQLRFAETIDTILLGRVTYRMFADYWPTATTDTDKAADMLNDAQDRLLEDAEPRALGEMGPGDRRQDRCG